MIRIRLIGSVEQMVMLTRVPCIGEEVCVHDGEAHVVYRVEHLTLVRADGPAVAVISVRKHS
jgi:hypothetical protein